MKCYILATGIFSLTVSLVGCLAGDVHYLLEYRDAQFQAGREKVYGFSSGGLKDNYRDSDYQIINMYLKLNDGTVVKLSELSEETAREWIAKKSASIRDESITESTDQNGMKSTRYNIDGYNRLLYRDGDLVECHIGGPLSRGPLAGVEIGPSAEGDFLSFPILREDLFRAFGQPKEIRKVSYRPPN